MYPKLLRLLQYVVFTGENNIWIITVKFYYVDFYEAFYKVDHVLVTNKGHINVMRFM